MKVTRRVTKKIGNNDLGSTWATRGRNNQKQGKKVKMATLFLNLNLRPGNF